MFILAWQEWLSRLRRNRIIKVFWDGPEGISGFFFSNYVFSAFLLQVNSIHQVSIGFGNAVKPVFSPYEVTKARISQFSKS